MMEHPTNNIVEGKADSDWAEPGLWIVIAGNLVPLAGVLFFGWETFSLLLLYWCENVLIGVFNVLRMLFAQPSERMLWAAKAFFIPFFSVHYGLFTFVHGVFVVTLFGSKQGRSGFPGPARFLEAIQENHLVWAVLCIAGSYAAHFVWQYLRTGEYKQASLPRLMIEPYARIFVLHITILIGAFIMLALNAPAIVLVLLVGLKMAFDIWRYQRDRYRSADGPADKLTQLLTSFRGGGSR